MYLNLNVAIIKMNQSTYLHYLDNIDIKTRVYRKIDIFHWCKDRSLVTRGCIVCYYEVLKSKLASYRPFYSRLKNK